MGIIRKTWNGEVILFRTFWIGFFPSVIISALMSTKYYKLLIIKSITISPPLSILLALFIPLALLTYQVFMGISTWRSSNHYQGNKLWGVTAKAVLVIYIVAPLLIIIGFFKFFPSSDDPGKDSSNISKFLKKDSEYTFIGFWKNKCTDDFGLSVDKVGNGFYSVSFCGPGGCFKPGTYRPNTKIIGDSAYKIIDDNTLQVQGADGYSYYQRCN